MSDDPYRVLGVDRGTPVAEIRRAYRRLVKEHHPDSAGPAALQRFLSIQAAYEELVEGKARLRDVGRASSGTPRPAWRADPERARATREHWRRRTSRPGGGAGSGGAAAGPGERGGAARRDERRTGAPRPGTGDPQPGAGPGASRSGPPPPGEGTNRSRPDGPRSSRSSRATPGSTTYDGAEREPFDPEWGGASWYGPSSGTYWTINPKEYADPRKHGPEYQARARRGARASGASPESLRGRAASGQDAPIAGDAVRADAPATNDGAPPSTDAPRSDATRPWPPSPPHDDRSRRPEQEPDTKPDLAAGSTAPGRPAPAATPGSGRRSRHGPGRAFEADDRRPGGTDTARTAQTPDAAPAAQAPDPPPAAPPTEAAALVPWIAALRSPGRLLTALIAWPPIGLGAALLYGELSGCARFAAACEDAMAPWPWLIQLATIAFFLVLPVAARIAVFGTYAALIAATPLTLFVVTGSRPGSELAAQVLIGCLALAWVAGIVIALTRRRHRRDGAPPVP